MPVARKTLGALALAGTTVFTSHAVAATSDPTGVWLDDTGRGAVEITSCGSAFCGRVVWVKSATDSKGCGHQIIGNVKSAGQGTWDNGWIYDPERDSKFDVELKMLKGDKLKVTGYAGLKFLSKSMIWTRAPADLARCDGTTTAAAPVATTRPLETASIAPAPTPPSTSQSPSVSPAAPATPGEPAAAKATPPTVEEEQEVASNEEKADLDVSNFGDKLGDVLSRSPDGKCNLDLPWVKLSFKCDKAKN